MELRYDQLMTDASLLVTWTPLTSPITPHAQDLVQRAEALQMLVDVQMEAEGWGKEQRLGALGAGLTVNSAQSLMQVWTEWHSHICVRALIRTLFLNRIVTGSWPLTSPP